MDAKTLEEGKALLAQIKMHEPNETEDSMPAALLCARFELMKWISDHRDELIADAGRLEALIAGFRIMSPKMDGNHVWTWSHHPKLIGPNMKAAIDAAMGDKP